jgi:hypothetical protein
MDDITIPRQYAKHQRFAVLVMAAKLSNAFNFRGRQKSNAAYGAGMTATKHKAVRSVSAAFLFCGV